MRGLRPHFGKLGALDHHAVIVTAPVERRFAILQRLAELGPVHHFETEKPSLERVYVEYVEQSHEATS